jgi:hypothetical protein
MRDVPQLRTQHGETNGSEERGMNVDEERTIHTSLQVHALTATESNTPAGAGAVGGWWMGGNVMVCAR